MWVISEERSINLDNVLSISLGANYFHYSDSSLLFKGISIEVLDCDTYENAKTMLKEINQAIYDGKKTFNFDAHLNYIEKRRQKND